MEWYWIVIVIAYFLIGGLVAYLLRFWIDDTPEFIALIIGLIWPMIVLILSPLTIIYLVAKLIGKIFKKEVI